MAWNRPSNDGNTPGSPRRGRSPRPTVAVRGAIAGALVVLGAAVAWFVLSSEGERGEGAAAKGRGRIKEVASAKGAKAKPQGAKAKPKPIKTRDVAEAVRNVGEFEPPEIPKAKEPVYIDKFTNRYFKTSVEQVMGWVFTCKPGLMPPPLPSFSDEDYDQLASILISKNTVKESDDEKAAEAKETVDFAKKEMMKYIREGGDPQEFMNYYHKLLREASDYRDIVVGQAQQIYEEDPGLAEDFLKEVNAKLDEKGIVRVELNDIKD